MDKTIFDRLEKDGWMEFENITSDAELIAISERIGQIISHPNGELVSILTPNNGESAIRGTFSNIYGYGSFPLHTDTAFWPKPSRYILLSSIKSSDCSTLVVSVDSILNQLSDKERKESERAIFKIKTIHGQFYSSLLFRENNIEGIKYDPTCMIPVNSFAKKFMQKIEQVAGIIPKNEIKWTGSKAVIIDNWKMLHGREVASKFESRELKRIYII